MTLFHIAARVRPVPSRHAARRWPVAAAALGASQARQAAQALAGGGVAGLPGTAAGQGGGGGLHCVFSGRYFSN